MHYCFIVSASDGATDFMTNAKKPVEQVWP